MGLDGELIGAASRLHDLGMNGVAERPAPLTPAERSEVHEHPLKGHAMLAGAGEPAFELAAEIALTHHERFAGDGYPNQLRGEDIPLAGRIVAVADAFDALTTDRVYRPAGTIEGAVNTLKAERGTQLDPRIVDVFLDDLDVAVTALRRHAPEPPVAALDETFLSLHAAAETLRISPSRLRRWSDEGRIETHRTPGGHRRFPLEAVRRLSEEIGVQPVVRPMDPPDGPVIALAEILRAHGPKLAAAAAASLYRDGPPGWFASEDAVEVLDSWTAALADGCAQSRYVAAEASSDALMRYAHTARGDAARAPLVPGALRAADAAVGPPVRRRSRRAQQGAARVQRDPAAPARRDAPDWIRTSDLALRRRALYPLSYGRSGSLA